MQLSFTSHIKCQNVSLSSLACSCCICWNPSHYSSETEEVDKSKMSLCTVKNSSKKLENIDENGPARWLQLSCSLPETPTESMEFLGRSWSLSAMELSKALAKAHIASSNGVDDDKSSSTSCAGNIETNDSSITASRQSLILQPTSDNSPPIIPLGEVKI